VDLRGHHVRTLVSGHQAAGRHRIGWDGLDDAGRPVASGTYVVRLDDGRQRQARKVMLAR
jgi:flagellar hook assembly protein FlgD